MEFLYCKDIMKILGICDKKAYELIARLNKELENRGYITFRGRVPKKYFIERCCYVQGSEK